MDILDQLSSAMDEPDLSEMLAQSIEHEFHLRYPQSTITIYSTEDPSHNVLVNVGVKPPGLTYYMILTDEWVDDDNGWQFTFTCDSPRDNITVNLAET